MPAAREGFVFEPVNLRLGHGGKAGLERTEPVPVPPVQGDGAEGAAGEFRQRVVRDGFPAVQEKRQVVIPEGAGQGLVAALEAAHEHGAIAKAPAAAHELPDGAGRQHGLGLGRRAAH